MTKIKIALEWFLNPDHLPLIAGIESGAYKKAGLDVELIEPKEHYDGFEYLKSGDIDIHVNEPLHLFEHYFDGIKSIGCFFETRGGVMIRSESMNKLRENKHIKITTPASNDVTNTIGFEILKRYAKKEGFELSRQNVEFIQTDFYHIKNMQEGDYDGAWLCFYNFEGIEAEYKSFSNTFIDAMKSPYPNFSALELMTSQAVLDKKAEALCQFIGITNQMAQYLKENLTQARDIFYAYSKAEKTELLDKIIADTIPRFETDIKASTTRWYELCNFLTELKLVDITDDQYKSIWATH
ncbi:ABC transporter substrate-binding protein [Arcobacter sp. FWKO B]|uniref:ABC transporter substrate-binding protein n=1 Tax=Arcobacter sp. FWKO B TaxID=2593672 RepID=UPI0018A4E548|nr:ABC transporter substrate-binding protein [Arcobacter sp. FWKO B]QOG12866.1 ABC transporter substrate-binding protein [Arcobacter sp. FWKO B]